MGNVNTVNNTNSKKTEYVFRPFQYEKIEPVKVPGKRDPVARSGHRIVCDSRNLYSFGGYNPSDSVAHDNDEYTIQSYPLFQELWKYNFGSKKWSRFENRKSLPQELVSNAMIRLNNFLMVYGGTGSPFGYRCSNQLYICSLSGKNNDMREIQTKGQLPVPQYGQALIYHNDYLYTIGGTTGYQYTCDIHRLNIWTQVWESIYICKGQVDYEPEGRYRHEVAFDGKYIFILGGGTVEEAFDFVKLPAFDIETRQWSRKLTTGDPTLPFSTCIPSPRKCHGAVQIENENGISVFITGGDDGENVFSDLWKLNLTNFQWTLITTFQLPHPTYFHSCAVTPAGKMYIFGGIYRMREIIRNNKIHATWLCIPKLSEICWEALLHYYPQMVYCCKEKLVKMGIARNFLQRLEE